jgi:hypothetical protein
LFELVNLIKKGERNLSLLTIGNLVGYQFFITFVFMSQKLNSRQKILINSIIQELQEIEKRDDVDNISNIIGVKKLCRIMNEENITNFNQSFDLEVYMIGLLNLLKESK